MSKHIKTDSVGLFSTSAAGKTSGVIKKENHYFYLSFNFIQIYCKYSNIATTETN